MLLLPLLVLHCQRCEAVGVEGQAACKSRATHGDPDEGATACQLHKTDDMVSG